MKLNANAKINLGLHVVGKRNDGFHNIETIFYRIDLHDVITLERSNIIEVSSSNSSLPVNKDNLCGKAVELLHRELKITDGIKIHIEKNIPIGAGLGGGSSDAATVVMHAPVLWGKEIHQAQLEKLSLQIGSDVPFFLNTSSAYAEGRGEELNAFQLKLPWWIVLVYPNIHVSTPWAYKALSEKRNGSFPVRDSIKKIFPNPPLKKILSLGNDFEDVVFDHYPSIAHIKKSLLQHGAVYSLMSGSGSSVFGFFEKELDAVGALKEFEKDFFVHVTKPDFSAI